MAAVNADRNLLFGLLALQTGMINQGQLVAAFQAWTLDKMRSLADHLEARGDLTSGKRAVLEALAAVHLEANGGDAEQSLAAVPSSRSARASLAGLGEPDIEATLARITRNKNGQVTGADDDDDAGRTATYSVGTATSDGQRFRILRPYARGGLGAVFVALDGELHREVALKQILEKHADDPVSRHRFVAEAEITGGLEHPGVVPVYGLGTDARGRPYYAMRFIKGESLKDAIVRFHDLTGSRELELRRLLRRFLDICNAIDYAHSRGVIHRDLKPANIIVGNYGETLVVDWGLAKTVGRADPSAGEQTLARSSGGSSETLPGSALGTPAYMSPEQARGELNQLGPRSDVYSLGATLYCLLTGKPPFENQDVGVILRAVPEGHFPRPRQHDPALDKALEAVCLKAMATAPENRYPTPKALADDLDRWMADEPVTAWREPFWRRARRWARRNRTAVTAASVALLAVVVGLGAVTAVQARANSDLRAANGEVRRVNTELATEKARVQERYDLAMDAIKTFHTGVSEDFLLKEEKFKELRDRLLKSASDFYGKLGALLGKESDLASRRALAQASFEVADLTAKVGRDEVALAAHRAVLSRREELAADPAADVDAQVDVARSLTAVASLLELTGKTDEAGATYRTAEALLADLARSYPSAPAARAVLAACRAQFGMFLSKTGKSADALALYRLARADQEALGAAPGASNEARHDLAITIRRIGGLLSETGKLSEAEAEGRKGLAIVQKLADDNPSVTNFRGDLASSHINLGSVLWKSGKLAEAEAEWRKAVAIQQKLADDSPAVSSFRSTLAMIHSNLGVMLLQTGKPAEAEAEYRKAPALLQKLIDDNPGVPDFRQLLATTHGNLGILLAETGKPAEAEAEYRKSVAILQRLADDNIAVTIFRERLAASHCNLGYLLWRTGKPAEAEAVHRKALALFQKLADDNPKVSSYREGVAAEHINLGDALRSLGRPVEARDGCDRAVGVLEPMVKASPTIKTSRLLLADSLRRRGLARRDLGDPAGAARDTRRALSLYEGLPSRGSYEMFEMASCHAALAAEAGSHGSGVSAAEGKAEADQAMALLWKTLGMGYRDAANFRTESALDPLRDRPDFRLLIMDLAFPKDSFARGR